jgi:Sigma-70 region 2
MIDTGSSREHRGLLFDVAYRMTGSVADAEDLVREAWLRWVGGGLGAGGQPAISLDVSGGRIVAARFVVNPKKLRGLRS